MRLIFQTHSANAKCSCALVVRRSLGNRRRQKLGKGFFGHNQSWVGRIETETSIRRFRRAARGRDQRGRGGANILVRDITLFAALQSYFAGSEGRTYQAQELAFFEHLLGLAASHGRVAIKSSRFGRDSVEFLRGSGRGAFPHNAAAVSEQDDYR